MARSAAVLVRYDDADARAERSAVAGFLSGDEIEVVDRPAHNGGIAVITRRGLLAA